MHDREKNLELAAGADRPDSNHMKGISAYLSVTVFAVVLGALAPSAHAETAASKNKQGNKLFEQGKYQEAEKAYLDAEIQSPGRPEILYNLGNTLVKQKKYEQAVQSLRQAIGKGDKKLEQSGWFNTGNVLYEMGNLKDAVQAYVQSLRIDPSDKDAKYNLEMALQKMKQQKQMGAGKDQKENPEHSEDSKQKQQSANNRPDSKQRENKEKQQTSPSQEQESNKPSNPQATQAEKREESLSKERALQILDALKNQELAEQRKLMEMKARRKTNARDW